MEQFNRSTESQQKYIVHVEFKTASYKATSILVDFVSEAYHDACSSGVHPKRISDT